MDYRGQWLAEQLYYYIILVFGAVGWVVGFMQQDFMLTVYGWGAGMIISLVLCIPDWPWYNKHPVKWLDEIPNRKAAQ